MVCCEQSLLMGTCNVRRRQRPCLFTAVIILALAVAVLMGAGSAFMVAVTAAVPRLQSRAPGLSGQFAGVATTSATSRPQSAMAALSWMPSMPQTCDDDFDCNGGRANFPLQCLDMVFLKVCVDPDDFERSTAASGELAYVPIPVQADDNLHRRQGL